MKKIVLISCVSEKRSQRSKAKDLYISTLFKKSLAYAFQLKPDSIYILSAKYGLLNLETEIEPYDLTLNTMPADEIKAWAENVLTQLVQVSDLRADHFIFLAGMKYRKYLTPHIASYEVPMEGLDRYKQLHYLSLQYGTDNEIRRFQPRENFSDGNRRLGMAGKYSLLDKYLSALPINQRDITLSFGQIERIINDILPLSALRYRAWWSNETEGSHVQARGWLDAGWVVDTVDFTGKQVRLVRKGGR